MIKCDNYPCQLSDAIMKDVCKQLDEVSKSIKQMSVRIEEIASKIEGIASTHELLCRHTSEISGIKERVENLAIRRFMPMPFTPLRIPRALSSTAEDETLSLD